MKHTTKLISATAFCLLFLIAATQARAESITLFLNGVSQGTFACTGTNGCFGNDIELDVSAGGMGDPDWIVTLDIDTANNTNPGSGIAAVAFVLSGFTFDSTDVELTGAPGGPATWTSEAGPASANGCNNASSNSICAEDTSVINSGTGMDASPLGITYTWEWGIDNQTFGGFDENTHIQVLFGNLSTDCPGGASAPDNCFLQTGLISSNTALNGQVPEPTTLTLVSLGLLGIGAVIRRHTRG
jgi:hypothetical protein